MGRKKIIQVIVIVACFAGSGFVLYNGLFSNKQGSAPVSAIPAGVEGYMPAPGAMPAAGPSQAAGSSQEQLLPYGDDFDFTKLKEGRFQFNAVSYPAINTSTDVGINMQALIK